MAPVVTERCDYQQISNSSEGAREGFGSAHLHVMGLRCARVCNGVPKAVRQAHQQAHLTAELHALHAWPGQRAGASMNLTWRHLKRKGAPRD